jgi:hypothetical protein
LINFQVLAPLLTATAVTAEFEFDRLATVFVCESDPAAAHEAPPLFLVNNNIFRHHHHHYHHFSESLERPIEKET